MGAIVLWNVEQEQELKRLFETLFEGAYLSHKSISELIHKSRNAVVGKIHRLKLTRDPLIPCRGVDGRIASSGQQKLSTTVAYGRKGTATPPRTYGGRTVAGEAPAAPSPHAVQILETTDATCKFPIGHVGREGFHFCGDVVGDRKPYCLHHAAICYIAPKDRHRERMAFYTPGESRAGIR